MAKHQQLFIQITESPKRWHVCTFDRRGDELVLHTYTTRMQARRKMKELVAEAVGQAAADRHFPKKR